MRIRDLRLGRIKAWPPVWKAAGGKRFVLGEEGILEEARARSYDSITIRIRHGNEAHIGLFVWDSPPSPQVLADLMNRAAGATMREIGNLDLPDAAAPDRQHDAQEERQ